MFHSNNILRLILSEFCIVKIDNYLAQRAVDSLFSPTNLLSLLKATIKSFKYV